MDSSKSASAKPTEPALDKAKIATQVQESPSDAASTASAPADAAANQTSDSVVADLDQVLADLQKIVGANVSSASPQHGSSDDSSLLVMAAQPQATPGVGSTTVHAPTAATPQTQLVEATHEKIVTAVHGQLLPNGGTMRIRLDPPELGALQISVHMRDGVMTAAFETSSDQATRLLSHSLNQLKTVLESAGVSVEKLHVQQSARQSSSSQDNSEDQPSGQQQQWQEQQRRQMLQRMWRKLSGVDDPLDLVA